MRDRSTSRSIRAARTSLTCVIGSRTSGLSIRPGAPQPVLDRRGAWLREQEPRQVGERAPGAQRSRLIAADEDIAHRRETRRVDMRGSQNAAFRALGQRRVEQRILAGHHRELRRLGADQVEGLLLVRAAILHARNVRKLREAQQRVVAHVHAGPIRDVVDEDRPPGRDRERREVAIESLLRGARVIGTRNQIAVDRPRGRVRERLGDLAGVAAGYAEIDGPLPADFGGDDRNKPFGLILIDGQSLAGRRSEDEPIERLSEVVAHHAPQRCLIERAVAERRHQRQPEFLQYSSSFSSHVSRRSRAQTEKTPSEPAGPLRSSRLLMLNRTARAKTQFPRRRIFSLSVRCGSACAQYRGRTRRCQRKRQGDSRP